MRTIRTAMIAGTAAIGLVGLPGAASAQSPRIHVMNVQLPDGGVAQVQYVGDVPPQIAVANAPTVAPLGFPMFMAMPSLFGSESPFAMMDRISAAMDRQMAAVMQSAQTLPTLNATQMTEAAMRNLPAGAQSYSFSSTLSGNGVCVRSVQITSSGNGAEPKVVSHSSGNCGPETAPQVNGVPGGSVNLPSTTAPVKRPDTLWINNPAPSAPAKRPDTLRVKSDKPVPYAGMVQQTAARQ